MEGMLSALRGQRVDVGGGTVSANFMPPMHSIRNQGTLQLYHR